MKQAASTAFLAKDLVCGMIVDTRGAIFKASYAGKVYYFCSSECLKLFKRRAKLYSMDFLETLPATRLMDDNQFAERQVDGQSCGVGKCPTDNFVGKPEQGGRG